mgnify:CR=1 FL=1
MIRKIHTRSILLSCAAIVAWVAPITADARDLLANFAYLGCNRVGYSAQTPSEPSTANVAQMQQTFKDIAALPVKPDYFFFAGDLVLGMSADKGVTLSNELTAWKALYDKSNFAASGIELLPLPGNHEADASEEVSPGEYIEYPDADNLSVWVDWLKTNNFAKASNGPSGNKELQRDLLAEDNNQTQTYSFDDVKTGVHYVLLNTDSLSTVVNPLLPEKTVASWAPLHWVEADFKKASANPAIKRIVVLAHKPLVLSNPGPHDIVYNTAPYTLGDSLLELFGDTPKFSGYFAAHSHQWLYTDKIGPKQNVTQVLAGNGGSQLNGGWDPKGGPYFGFTVVNIYDDNTVGVVSHARPAPTPYNTSAPQPAAKAMPEIFFPVVGQGNIKGK